MKTTKLLIYLVFILIYTFSFSTYVSSEEDTDEPEIILPSPVEEIEPKPEPIETPKEEEETPTQPKEEQIKDEKPKQQPKEQEKPIDQQKPKESPSPIEPTPKVRNEEKEISNSPQQIAPPQSAPIEQVNVEEIEENNQDLIDIIVSYFSNLDDIVTSFDHYILRNILSIILYNEPLETTLASFSNQPMLDLSKKLSNEQVEELQLLINNEMFELHPEFEIVKGRVEELVRLRQEFVSLVTNRELPVVIEQLGKIEENNELVVEEDGQKKDYVPSVITKFIKWLGSLFT
jgi:type IV secretory pathway VirB10-like protein